MAARATAVDGPERDAARTAFHRKYLGARVPAPRLVAWSNRVPGRARRV